MKHDKIRLELFSSPTVITVRTMADPRSIVGQGGWATTRGGRGGRGRNAARGGRLLTENTVADQRPVSPWRTSRAKAKLQCLLLDKSSHIHEAGLTVEQIHSSDPLFAKYAIQNFKTNYRNLKQSIEMEWTCIQFDGLSIQKDKDAFPRQPLTQRGYPFWDTHQAKTLLAEDVKQGRAKDMKPNSLRNTQTCYQDFPAPVFTKHVHQEIRRQREAVAWQDRRNKKGRKLHDYEAQELQSEEQRRLERQQSEM